MSVLPFRFSLIGGMTPCSANRRTFKDFSLKGPTPTAGLSSARIGRICPLRKRQLRWALCPARTAASQALASALRSVKSATLRAG